MSAKEKAWIEYFYFLEEKKGLSLKVFLSGGLECTCTQINTGVKTRLGRIDAVDSDGDQVAFHVSDVIKVEKLNTK